MLPAAPCAAVVAQIYCSLPRLHSRAASIWCRSRRCRARPALGWGAVREPALLQLAPFEVQYFHLLPMTAVLLQLRIARHPQCSRASLCDPTPALLLSLYFSP